MHTERKLKYEFLCDITKLVCTVLYLVSYIAVSNVGLENLNCSSFDVILNHN